MRVADLWFSAIWVLLISTYSSLALATAKGANVLFGVPSGGSTATKQRHQAVSIDTSSTEMPTTVSGTTTSSEL